MVYTADPTNVNLPTDAEFAGLASPAEIRALKQRVIDVISQLQGYTDTGVSEASSQLNQLISNLTTALTNLTDAYTLHTNTENAHNVTRVLLAVDKVNNFPASNSYATMPEAEAKATYATIWVAKLLASAISDLTTALNSTNQNLTSETNARQSADSTINSTLTSHGNSIAGHTDSIIDIQNNVTSLINFKNNDVATVLSQSSSSSVSNGNTKLATAYRNSLPDGTYYATVQSGGQWPYTTTTLFKIVGGALLATVNDGDDVKCKLSFNSASSFTFLVSTGTTLLSIKHTPY